MSGFKAWRLRLANSNWRLGGFLTLILVGFGLLMTLLMVQVSSRPQFCGSCHVMAPYYASWTTSTHKEVACVQCHIPPGIHSEIEKKKEAISMVVSYFTGTYGTNPWAEIDDAACLQCHQRRLLSGREVFKDILFDHGPHLTELRREKKLRCTSCHSQIVQGSHISVTTSTCILCHFKAQPAGSGSARCTLCHEVPNRIIEKGTLSFDHGDVSRFDMKCSWCHAHVTKGDGDVPRQRCVVCHNEPSRLERYDDHAALHRIHVTDHKVECLHCHTEIQHGSFAPRSEVAGTECQSCHAGGHSPQRDLFVGIGAKGVEPRPSAMHLAGIHCEGCHFLEKEIGSGHVQSANEVSCMACHGPRYSKMLGRWRTLMEKRVGTARKDLASYRRLAGAANPQPLADAEANLRLVEEGRGVHNIDYALDILKANRKMLNAALESVGHSSLPGSSWREIPYESDCLRCHQGIESQVVPFAGRTFDHGPHVIGFELSCDGCHLSHEEREAGEQAQISSADCAPCHHTKAVTARTECADCHAGITSKTVSFDGEDFEHEVHVVEEELECADCHTSQVRPGLDLEACADCHD